MVARRGWLLAVDGCLLWMVARCGWLLAVNGCDLGQERRRDNSIILLSHDASYFLDDSPHMIRCIGEVVKAGLFSSGQVLAPHSKFLGAPSLPERSEGPAKAEAGLSADVRLPKRSEGPAKAEG